MRWAYDYFIAIFHGEQAKAGHAYPGGFWNAGRPLPRTVQVFYDDVDTPIFISMAAFRY